MSVRLFHVTTIAICLCAHSIAVRAQSGTNARPSPEALAAAVDSFTTRATATGLTSAFGVAIVMDGQTIYRRAFGMANATLGIPADTNTLWYIASTSKSFTGFAISLLASDGTIDIHAPITTLLPRAKWHPDARPEQLTLADFLTHTQGLAPGAVVINAAFTGNVPETRWPELLRYSEPLPTRDMIYNNLGYNVAAMVIDARRPEGWRAFLDRNVFRPAGMHQTYHRVSRLDRRRFAMPHDITKERTFVTRPFLKTDVTMNAAGGHLSTLGDLARWVTINMQDGMIDGQQVFPAAVVRQAHQLLAGHTREASRTFGPFSRTGWAMGWDIGSYEGEPMVSRFGAYETIRSHISYLPGRHIGVVAQSTAETGSALTDIVAAYAYDLEAGRPDAGARADTRMAVAMSRLERIPARLAAFDSVTESRKRPLLHPITAFTGTFENPGYGQISWTVRGGKLQYRFGAYSGSADIYDAAANQFRIEFGGSGTVATFTIGPAGRASEVSLGGNMVFTRRVGR
jgi:CubicO group peptidase (beta-lactamase class C family)